MSLWAGRLGSLRQYQDVPYVTIAYDGGVRCDLCGTAWMRKKQRVAHFNGSRHSSNYYEVKRLEQTSHSLNRMILLEPRVKQLSLEKWRDVVKSAMYDFTLVLQVPIVFTIMWLHIYQSTNEWRSLLSLSWLYGSTLHSMERCFQALTRYVNTQSLTRPSMSTNISERLVSAVAARASFPESMHSYNYYFFVALS